MSHTDASFTLPWLRACAAVARRPHLWRTALGAARSHAPQQWWRSVPPVPTPDRQWMQFRLTTAYGTPGDSDGATTTKTTLDPGELIEWLEWLRSWNTHHDHAT